MKDVQTPPASHSGRIPGMCRVSAKPAEAGARPLGILVADDEPDVRRVLALGLQRDGFRVWPAEDGRQALDLYRQHCRDIDLVLLDVSMPGLDGPQTLDALRQLDPQVVCCFLSGGLGRYTEEELFQRGASLVLRKPLSLSQLARDLRQLAAAASTHIS